MAPASIEQDILDRVEQGFCLKQPDGASDDSDYQKYGFISSCEIYDEVVCRKVPALLPGHGCDGIDNNCDADLTPDECAEDEFPPTIDFSNAHEFCGNDKHIFPTPDAAKACLTKQVMTTDDCYPVSTMVGDAVETSSSAKCGTTYAFSVGASEDICNKTSSGSFMVLVDSNIDPTQSACEFSKGPDVPPELNVIQAKENCGRNTFFSSKENALECVRIGFCCHFFVHYLLHNRTYTLYSWLLYVYRLNTTPQQKTNAVLLILHMLILMLPVPQKRSPTVQKQSRLL